MKRGAERQIQREDGEDPHGVDEEGSNDSQSGSEVEARKIASRPIRGLPKKKPNDAPTSLFAQTPSPTPFTFAGFGTSSASTSTAPANSSFSGFGASSTGSTNASTSSLSPAAAPFVFSTPATSVTPTVNGKANSKNDSAEVDYFCTLRGLNISLKSQLTEALTKEMNKDPFADLSQVLKAVQIKYESIREEAKGKRKSTALDQTAPSPVPKTTSTFSFSTPTAPTSISSAVPIVAAAKTASTPSFSLPKPPANGGFSFAGSSFSPNSTSKEAPSLLPGQPIFKLPSTGFYSSFGKQNDDDDDDDDDGEKEVKEEAGGGRGEAEIPEHRNNDQTAKATPFAASTSTSNAFTTTAPTSDFPSNTFSFGSASTTPSSPTANSAASNAYRFSFGGSPKVDDADKAKDQDTTPSLFSSSSSPSKTPSIGFNFANTSGVKQAGAFSFGSSNINFGSSPSAFGSGVNSTGFSFGSSPTKDTLKKSDDSENAS